MEGEIELINIYVFLCFSYDTYLQTFSTSNYTFLDKYPSYMEELTLIKHTTKYPRNKTRLNLNGTL